MVVDLPEPSRAVIHEAAINESLVCNDKETTLWTSLLAGYAAPNLGSLKSQARWACPMSGFHTEATALSFPLSCSSGWTRLAPEWFDSHD